MVLSEEDAVDLASFLVTAARCILDEPTDYAPLRLLTAAERLCRRAEARSSEATRAVFCRLASEIPPNLARRNAEPEAFRAFLDGACRLVAGELMRRAGRGGQP